MRSPIPPAEPGLEAPAPLGGGGGGLPFFGLPGGPGGVPDGGPGGLDGGGVPDGGPCGADGVGGVGGFPEGLAGAAVFFSFGAPVPIELPII